MTYQRRRPWPMAALLQTRVRGKESEVFKAIAANRNMTTAALLRFAVRYVIENERHMRIVDPKKARTPM